ncbi:hypothetical protein BK142_14030 [Paenibacillus glucanolyticus]|nr:hypothetical protein BK142_14030 [Paenibacillus glucanolyticus]
MSEKCLTLGPEVLYYRDCVNYSEDTVQKVLEFVKLKSGQYGSPRYVNCINDCDHCGHGVYNTKQDHNEHWCDYWSISIFADEPDEDGFEMYDLDWERIMGDASSYADNEIRIYRCHNCKTWLVDPD